MYKTIIINIAITLSLIGFLILIPPSVYYSSKVLDIFGSCENNEDCELDNRGLLPIYDDYEWSTIHFKEFEKTFTDEYEDYVGWSRKDFEGYTISINNGLRRTIEPLSKTNHQVWFFGGSTLWGTGSNDENTIPSLFAKKSQTSSKNFAETGYRLRQSLNRLINLIFTNNYEINSNKKTLIVMYGAAVDIYAGCSINNDGISTTRENIIRASVNANKNRFTIKKTFNQLIQFIQRVSPKTNDTSDKHDCNTNSEKANKVSNEIFQSVRLSGQIAKLNNYDFIFIIEPLVSKEQANINNIGFSGNSLDQADAVLLPLKGLLDNNNINYLDLSSLLHGCKNCIIDSTGHLSPVGNQEVAYHISEWYQLNSEN